MSTLISFRMHNHILTKSLPVLLDFYRGRDQPLLNQCPRLLACPSPVPTIQFRSASSPRLEPMREREEGTLPLKGHLTLPSLAYLCHHSGSPSSPREKHAGNWLVSMSILIFIYFLFTCMCICLHEFLYTMCSQVPVEAKRQQIPWNWN